MCHTPMWVARGGRGLEGRCRSYQCCTPARASSGSLFLSRSSTAVAPRCCTLCGIARIGLPMIVRFCSLGSSASCGGKALTSFIEKSRVWTRCSGRRCSTGSSRMPFCCTCTSIRFGYSPRGGSTPSLFSPKSRCSSGAATVSGIWRDAAVSLLQHKETCRSRGQSHSACGIMLMAFRSAMTSVRLGRGHEMKPSSLSLLRLTLTDLSSGHSPRSGGSPTRPFWLTSSAIRVGTTSTRACGTSESLLKLASMRVSDSGYPAAGSCERDMPLTLSSVPSLVMLRARSPKPAPSGALLELVIVWKGALAAADW
mmetsp:Transcript_20862/g.42354  ORF Transcript_20862/g.42354 Transcript_20862/m.42354 type:complete len:311 (-) Transcript_20862:186-1118(-)